MMDENKGIYTIGTISQIISEHPETLRVWEKNGLIKPERYNTQRKYSNNDLKRLRFIVYLIHNRGLNIAGVNQVISMYPCWFNVECGGGLQKNSQIQVNHSKECWKNEGTYCVVISDKTELCGACNINMKCANCKK